MYKSRKDLSAHEIMSLVWPPSDLWGLYWTPKSQNISSCLEQKPNTAQIPSLEGTEADSALASVSISWVRQKSQERILYSNLSNHRAFQKKWLGLNFTLTAWIHVEYKVLLPFAALQFPVSYLWLYWFRLLANVVQFFVRHCLEIYIFELTRFSHANSANVRSNLQNLYQGQTKNTGIYCLEGVKEHLRRSTFIAVVP